MLDAIGIVSDDVAKSVAFYRLLGVDLVKAGAHDHYEARTASGLRILLDAVALIRTIEPDYRKPTTGGVVMCFKQASAAAVDALYARITDAGFASKKGPWDAFWGQRYACVLDPDGNQIDLFASLTAS
jgi:catechol 2,3-dioxygenase-like lactoylglutathione lyase family enzyme